MARQKHPAPLLIVDDRPEVLRGVQRYLRLSFEKVSIAATVKEAESLMRDEQPELLLCDYWLGNDVAPATELIPRWRAEFGHLRKVALMTGTKSTSLEGADGIDRVYRKPLDLEDVVAFFQG